MTNDMNLISLKDRTEKERKEIASKGGKKSGEIRREKVELKKRLEIMLSIQDENGNYEEDNICKALILQAKQGNIKAFEVIRDTIGQKLIVKTDIEEKKQVDLSILSDEQIEKLAEMAIKEDEEKDKKIIALKKEVDKLEKFIK